LLQIRHQRHDFIGVLRRRVNDLASLLIFQLGAGQLAKTSTVFLDTTLNLQNVVVCQQADAFDLLKAVAQGGRIIMDFLGRELRNDAPTHRCDKGRRVW